MKKIYAYVLLFTASIVFANSASAMLWNVTVNSSSFSPSTLPNVVCGDTVKWTYGSGNPHTTTSTSIPAGASSWDAPITTVGSTFQYVVPNFAGVYNYKCTPHNFFGSFTVTCSVGIDEALQQIVSAVYPNPFSPIISLTDHNADAVKIMDLTGQIVFATSLKTSGEKAEINLDALAPGIYFLITSKEGVISETKRIVKAK